FVLLVVLFGAHHHYIGGEAPVGQGGDQRLGPRGGGGLGGGQRRQGGGCEGGQREWRAARAGGGRWPGVDIALLGREPVGEGDARARTVVPGTHVLLGAFAEALLAYELGPRVVLERARHDLGGRGRAAVDQPAQGLIG